MFHECVSVFCVLVCMHGCALANWTHGGVGAQLWSSSGDLAIWSPLSVIARNKSSRLSAGKDGCASELSAETTL